MAITLLRHAALSSKYQGRYNGWTDISIDPLLFEEEKVSLLQNQHFDRVISSDLIRCQETLMMMNIIEYTTDERLREVRFKSHIEGLNFDEITALASYDKTLVASRDSWHAYICSETQVQFEKRIRSFLNALPKEEEILICSHGGTLQKMMAMLGYTKANIAYLEWIRIENGI